MRIKTSEFSLSEICKAIGSPRCEIADTIQHVTTSSKEVMAGDLFFALKGERYDGEDFCLEAKARGAYVVSSNPKVADILTENVENALLSLASYRKTRLKNLKSTVAITGSVGKTTTKNIISKMLSPFFKLHATNENENNTLGVSLTLLSAPEDTEVLIVELGMNHVGEIKRLSMAVKPDISVITAIGNAHIGNLGSISMIEKEKLSILEGMDAPTLISSHSFKTSPLPECKFISVSKEKSDAEYFIKTKNQNTNGSDFEVYTKDYGTLLLHTDIPGGHVVSAIAYGISVSHLLGVKNEDIRLGIGKISADCVRGRLISLGDFWVFDDTYSSSPEAIIADLELLSLYPNQKSCMLGDMLECGSKTKELHEMIGSLAYSYGAKRLYLYGVYAPFIARGAEQSGMPREKIFINTDILSPEITANQIREHYDKDEIILMKASHKLNAHKITEILKSKA